MGQDMNWGVSEGQGAEKTGRTYPRPRLVEPVFSSESENWDPAAG